MIYECKECGNCHKDAWLRDVGTCPDCGGELRQINGCGGHEWLKTKDEDGQIIRRCVNCGDFEQ